MITGMTMLTWLATVLTINALHPLNMKDAKTVYAPEDAQVPAVVDLSQDPNMPEPYNQQDLGSCTANALAGAYQFVHKTSWIPSRLMLYYGERELEHTTDKDNGAHPRDGIAVMQQCGVVPEPMWPYIYPSEFGPSKAWWNLGSKFFTYDPPCKVWDIAKQNRVKRAFKVQCDKNDLEGTEKTLQWVLSQGSPIVFGLQITFAFQPSPNGDVADPISVGEIGKRKFTFQEMMNCIPAGGHCLLLVGYDASTRRFKFRNSWGKKWGDGRGYGTLSLENLTQNLIDELWVIDPNDNVAGAARSD